MPDSQAKSAALAQLGAPAGNLGSIDSGTAGLLIASSIDITLVLDSDGTVRQATFAEPELARETQRDWIGQNWGDTVTVESKPKIQELLREAVSEKPSRWRQVNYPAVRGGPDVPVRFSVIRNRGDDRIIAVGRDLRMMASLQQRLVEAQQAMEREYARIRDAEKRYRLLFQLAAEAVVIVDAGNERILEANPAACTIIGRDARKVAGSTFSDLFDSSSRLTAQSFVAALRVAPRVDNVHVQLAGSRESLLLSGSLYRQESGSHLLVLLSRLGGDTAALPSEKASVLQLIDRIPDAFVVTDADRRILFANMAFVDLAQMANEGQIRGEPLDRWLGRPGVDIDVLFGNLGSHGTVRNFSTIFRGEYGATEDIEVAAAEISTNGRPCFGFGIRPSGWRTGKDRLGGRQLPRSVEQFTDLVGRVPLKNLVRETTDFVERLCIEAALELTRDNRASAAEMLGLSRQGLYSKLHRYGLGDASEADDRAND